MTDFEQFEKIKTEILKLEKENEKLNQKLTEENLDKNDKRIIAQERLITSLFKKIDNFKEIINKDHIQS